MGSSNAKEPGQNIPRSSSTLTGSPLHDVTDEKWRTLSNIDVDCASSTLVNTDSSASSGSLSPMSSDAVGTAPDEFYLRTLAPWRAAARRFTMSNLQKESEWIAKMQTRVRSPWLDSYFVYTSSLGTHTFFMTALPALFFFGFPEIGRGLVSVLAMGVYVASFIKDTICAPRPYAPPVTRLTIGSHHLEYGFPSTHSTNSVSIALYIYSLVHEQYFTVAAISTSTYSLICAFLTVYIFSIVIGRLYTGMHSLTDCVVGVALGAGIWGAHALWWVPVEAWLVGASRSSSWLPNWAGPLVITLLCGLMVHRHPQPADDCPCFEDAIAFISVIAGMLIVRWVAVFIGFDDDRIVSHMAGHALPFLSSGTWADSEAWRSATLWWGMALLKLTLGIAIIFAWRLLVKFFLHSFLPPLFRLLSYKILPRLVSIRILPKGSELPIRRFYTPATEYDGSVPEGGLHPIPSVIDLPATLHGDKEYYELDGELGGMKRRKGGKNRKKYSTTSWEKEEKSGYLAPIGAQNRSIYGASTVDEDSVSDDEVVKHYDADVLTKVVVYAGIGVLATGLIPIMFEVLGWGVHP